MILHSRPVRALLVLAPLALLGAACGDDDDEATTDTTAATEEETTTTTAPPETETTDDAGGTQLAGEATIEVADSPLGTILVSEGRTLYLFMPDNAGPSTCTGGCADTWPALVVDGGASAGEGIDQALLGTAPTADGGEQATIDGWPLYFFSGDAAPGDTNGQGIGGVWFVVAPDGTAIQ